MGGSPENFRITLTAYPSLYVIINLNLSNNCPVVLDQLRLAINKYIDEMLLTNDKLIKKIEKTIKMRAECIRIGVYYST